MIERKVVYTLNGKHYDTLEKVIDAAEDDFQKFVHQCNDLLAPGSKSTPSQVLALVVVMLNNAGVMHRLLTVIEEGKDLKDGQR